MRVSTAAGIIGAIIILTLAIAVAVQSGQQSPPTQAERDRALLEAAGESDRPAEPAPAPLTAPPGLTPACATYARNAIACYVAGRAPKLTWDALKAQFDSLRMLIDNGSGGAADDSCVQASDAVRSVASTLCPGVVWE